MPRRVTPTVDDDDLNLEDYEGAREEAKTNFAKLLVDYYFYLLKTWNVRHIPVTTLASHLGVAQSSLSAWFKGIRVPNMDNAIMIATKMQSYYGKQVLPSLGYPSLPLVYDEELKFIVASWPIMREEARKELEEIAKNERRHSKSNAASEGTDRRRDPPDEHNPPLASAMPTDQKPDVN